MDSTQALKLSASDVEKLPEAQALEVLAAHVKAKQKELPEALAASKSKALSRAAKKALYQLRSSGVELAEPARRDEGAAPSVTAGLSEFPALMSPVLGTGERVIFFSRQQRGGGIEAYQGVLHDEFGVQQLDRMESNRSAFRKRLRELQGSRKAIEVPIARILEELGRAWGRNLASKTQLSQPAHDNLRKLQVKLDETEPALPKPEAGDEALLPSSGALHDEPEVKEWLPGQAQIARLGEVVGPLEEKQTPRAELVQRAGKLAEEYFVGAPRQLYARRLWQIAEFFDGTDRPEAAKLARAEARLLFHHATAIGGFSRRLFEKLIELGAAAGGVSTLPKPPSR